MNKNIKSTLGLLALSIMLVSCEDDEKANGAILPRLFSPVDVTAEIVGQRAILNWKSVSGASHYTIVLAHDSAFTSATDTFQTDLLSYEFEGLANDTSYVAKVKANAEDPQRDSYYTLSNGFSFKED